MLSWSVMSDFSPKDCSLPGSTVHGISKARILDWFAISFSKQNLRFLHYGELQRYGSSATLYLIRKKKKLWMCKEKLHITCLACCFSTSGLLSHLYTFSKICWKVYQGCCSVTQSCSTLINLMDGSTPGFPFFHHLLEFPQTHVHWVNPDTQPSYPLLPPSPPAFKLSQHQGLFQWAGSSHQVAKVFELQLWHQSFQWIFRVDFL